MQIDQTPKQQVIDRIKKATTILITVNRNPNVDELASAIALSMILNKLDKSAVAVFGGEIPRAIDFLEPDKTFEDNVDGLRDFIIALDKEKADRLRYKVEGDVVRVYITPYKTTITEHDLQFSQGDFNVDLIIALGVSLSEDLDTAISSHGKVLHDAQIVTINDRTHHSSIGEVDWSDDNASSLSEMLMSVSEALQPGALDEPIASALLTGLVASTDRFRNEKTSPKVMTMAAQLMAAGANQQLIAENLEANETPPPEVEEPEAPEPTTDDTALKIDKSPQPIPLEPELAREEQPVLAEPVVAETPPAAEPVVPTPPPVVQPVVVEEPPVEPFELPSISAPAKDAVLQDLQEQTDTMTAQNPVASSPAPKPQGGWRDIMPPAANEPVMSVPAPQFSMPAPVEQTEQKNQILFSHEGERTAEPPVINTAPLNGTFVTPDEPQSVDPFGENPQLLAKNDNQFASSTTPGPSFEMPPLPGEPSVASLSQPTQRPTPPLQTAAASQPLVMPQPVVPPTFEPFVPPPASPQPVVDAPQDTTVPSSLDLDTAREAVSSLFGEPSIPTTLPQESPQATTVTTPPQAQLPNLPMPDFSTLPPLPGEIDTQLPATPPTPNLGFPEQSVQPPVNTSTDPSQFQLPGQS